MKKIIFVCLALLLSVVFMSANFASKPKPKKKVKSKVKTEKELQDIFLALYSIEEKIFANCSIKPNEITSEVCEPMFPVFTKMYI